MNLSQRPIVVAVESSEGSAEAIRQADARARQTGSHVIYCAAFHDVVQLDALMPEISLRSDADAVFVRVSREVRERVAELTGRDAETVDVHVTSGRPHEAVIREAEHAKAGLIVVAASDAPGVVGSLRGTLAERTVRGANIPVLVARPRELTGNVLAATDFSDGCVPALDAGAIEAKRVGGRLIALHCVDLAQLEWINGSFTATREWVDLSERSITSLRDAASTRLTAAMSRLGTDGEPVVVTGDPAAEILRAATERSAEIIVVGTAGRKGLARMALGSVAEAVVRHARTSVLVVRLDEAYEND